MDAEELLELLVGVGQRERGGHGGRDDAAEQAGPEGRHEVRGLEELEHHDVAGGEAGGAEAGEAVAGLGQELHDALLTGEVVSGVGDVCGTGACSGGVTACNADGDGITCDSELGFSIEACNGVDDDCDGLTDAADDDLLLEPCGSQKGVCGGAMKAPALCVGGDWGACIDED